MDDLRPSPAFRADLQIPDNKGAAGAITSVQRLEERSVRPRR
jgi:hypothetical protein